MTISFLYCTFNSCKRDVILESAPCHAGLNKTTPVETLSFTHLLKVQKTYCISSPVLVYFETSRKTNFNCKPPLIICFKSTDLIYSLGLTAHDDNLL